MSKGAAQDDYEALLPSQQERSWTKNAVRQKSGKVKVVLVAVAVVCFIALARSASKANAVIGMINSAQTSSGWIGAPAQAQVMPYTFQGGNASELMKVNQTLGFEKIIALNMPDRMDRKDELVMMAAASDLQIDYLYSQDAKKFNKNGLPFLGKDLTTAEIGCYRAHLDAWQHVVTHNIHSALIIEDDADWDVDVKYAVRQLWQPLATLLESRLKDDKQRTPTSHDPWLSQDWDLMYVGACFEWPHTAENHAVGVDAKQAPIVAYNDQTVADRENTEGTFAGYMDTFGYKLADKSKMSEQEYANFPRQRLIAQGNGPICTAAYAVSRRGAAKLLYHSTRDIFLAIDDRMSVLCHYGDVDCYAIVPPIISQWKTKDASMKNSEIRGNSSQVISEDLNHNPSVGASQNIRNSVRKNLHELLDGMHS